MLDFPSSPTEGLGYTGLGRTFVYKGGKWTRRAAWQVIAKTGGVANIHYISFTLPAGYGHFRFSACGFTPYAAADIDLIMMCNLTPDGATWPAAYAAYSYCYEGAIGSGGTIGGTNAQIGLAMKGPTGPLGRFDIDLHQAAAGDLPTFMATGGSYNGGSAVMQTGSYFNFSGPILQGLLQSDSGKKFSYNHTFLHGIAA